MCRVDRRSEIGLCSASGIPACLGREARVELLIVGMIGIPPDHSVDEMGIATNQDAQLVGLHAV